MQTAKDQLWEEVNIRRSKGMASGIQESRNYMKYSLVYTYKVTQHGYADELQNKVKRVEVVKVRKGYT